MTREEAILLSAYTGFLLAPDFSEVHKFCEDTLGHPIWTHEFADSCVQKEIQEKLRPQIMELVQNIATLRPISRERVEKVWRGEWITKHYVDGILEGTNFDECSKCGYQRVFENPELKTKYMFCPGCGRAMRDEAVDMVMERMEALHGTD